MALAWRILLSLAHAVPPTSPDHHLQWYRPSSRGPWQRQKKLSLSWGVPTTVNRTGGLVVMERFDSNSCYQIIVNFLFFFFREENKKETARGCLPVNRTPTAPWTITRVKSKSHRPIGFTVATDHCRQLWRCPEIVLPGLEDLGVVFGAWRAYFRISLELGSKWPTGLTTSGNRGEASLRIGHRISLPTGL